MKDNGFKLAKERSKRYPAKTITNANNADNIELLTATHAQAEFLQNSLERAVAGIGLYVNADKMEYMCFNKRGDISTLNGSSLKLVDNFTNLGSSMSLTENEINMRLAKAWTAIDWLMVLRKSDLTKKKRSFFHAVVVLIRQYGCTKWTLIKRMEKKLDGNYTRMLRAILNKPCKQQSTIEAVQPLTIHYKTYPS